MASTLRRRSTAEARNLNEEDMQFDLALREDMAHTLRMLHTDLSAVRGLQERRTFGLRDAFGVAVAFIGLVLAGVYGDTAKRSNVLARESIDIAKQANFVSLLGLCAGAQVCRPFKTMESIAQRLG